MRLNQLQFMDESRAGFAVLWLFILLESVLLGSMGGPQLLYFLKIKSNTINTGLCQSFALISIALILGLWRRRRLWESMSIKRLVEVDVVLHRAAILASENICKSPPEFFVTCNILDMNALCLPGRRPKIILGGGIRLLFRKNRDAAMAIISHECAHVSAKDTIFLFVTWYTYLAYLAITVVTCTLSMIDYLLRFLALYNQEKDNGTTLYTLAEVNISSIVLGTGLPAVISAVSAGVVLIYFIKLREYRADEMASSVGHRQALTDFLSDKKGVQSRLTILHILSRFHPTIAGRLNMMSSELNWAKFDWILLFGLAFVRERVVQFSWALGTDAINTDKLEYNHAMEKLFSSLTVQDFFAWLIVIYLTCLISLYAFRISSTRYKMGFPISSQFSLVSQIALMVFVGDLFGTLTSWNGLMLLRQNTIAGTSLGLIGEWVGHSGIEAFFAAWLSLSVIILTPLFMRMKPSKSLFRVPAFLCSTLIMAFILQIFPSLVYVFYLNNFAASYPFPVWKIEKMEVLTVPIFQNGPSTLQFLLVFILISFLQQLWALFLRGDGKMTERLIHSERLLTD